MSASLEYLERCAMELGFQVSALDRVTRLGGLAAAIGRHPLLKASLALKGGTALNLGFGAPSRLSVDLDFNFIGAVEREAMLAERPRLEAALTDLARRAGFRVKPSADAFAGRKLHLRYASALGPEDTIQVDLNYLFRVPLAPVEVRELWQPGELERPSLPVIAPEELLAGKLLALLDRCAARDAWDVAKLPPAMVQRLETPGFRPVFIALSGILAHPLHSYDRERLEERLDQSAIDERLAPMLARSSAPPAAELLGLAWSRVQRLTELSEHEREYVDRVQAGELRPELLFPSDPEAAGRLAHHPALRWKIHNARAHHRGGREAADREPEGTPGSSSP